MQGFGWATHKRENKKKLSGRAGSGGRIPELHHARIKAEGRKEDQKEVEATKKCPERREAGQRLPSSLQLILVKFRILGFVTASWSSFVSSAGRLILVKFRILGWSLNAASGSM
eukprot:896149-Rhodomonas_salina.3